MNKISTEEPQNFVPRFEIAGIFVEVGDEVLLMHRHPDKPYGETWGLPAGKIEKGETPEQAALRELEEETGIRLAQPLHKIAPLYVHLDQENYDFTFHTFRVRFAVKPQITHEPDAHIDWIWISPEQALSYPLIVGGLETFQFYLSIRN